MLALFCFSNHLMLRVGILLRNQLIEALSTTYSFPVLSILYLQARLTWETGRLLHPIPLEPFEGYCMAAEMRRDCTSTNLKEVD